MTLDSPYSAHRKGRGHRCLSPSVTTLPKCPKESRPGVAKGALSQTIIGSDFGSHIGHQRWAQKWAPNVPAWGRLWRTFLVTLIVLLF